jgi:hypothetical protein
MRKFLQVVNFALIIVMILALIATAKPVAEKIAAVVGSTSDTVIFWAKSALGAAVGMWLITSGIAAMTIPFVGIALIVVGLAIVTWAVWPVFSRRPGQKPDPVTITPQKAK